MTKEATNCLYLLLICIALLPMLRGGEMNDPLEDSFIYSISGDAIQNTRGGSYMGGSRIYIQGAGFSMEDPQQNQVLIGTLPCQVISFYSTDTTIICDTPPQAPGKYPITITVNGYKYSHCQTDCSWTYNQDISPKIRWMSNNSIAGSQFLGLFGKFYANDVTEIQSIKIGDYTCEVNTDDEQPVTLDYWNDNTLGCIVGNIPVGFYSVNSTTILGIGSSATSPDARFYSFAKNLSYSVLVSPLIANVSTNTISSAGGVLQITGTGFSSDVSGNSVTVAERICTVSASTTESITCVLDATTATTTPDIYLGGLGLEQRVYNSSSISFAKNYPDNFTSSNVLSSPIVPSSAQFSSKVQRIAGFFIAPVDGSYVFQISSNTASELWLDSVAHGTGTSAMVRIANVPSSSNEFSYFADPNQTSSGLTLQAKQMYYFTIYTGSSTTQAVNVALQLKPTNATVLQNLPPATSLLYSIQSIIVNYPRAIETWQFYVLGGVSGTYNLSLIQRDSATGAVTYTGTATIAVNASNWTVANALGYGFGYWGTSVNATMIDSSLTPTTITANCAGWQYDIAFLTSRTHAALPTFVLTSLRGSNLQARLNQTNQRSPLLSGNISVSWQSQIVANLPILQEFEWTLESQIRHFSTQLDFVRVERVGELRDGPEYRIYWVGVQDPTLANITIDFSGLVPDTTQGPINVNYITRRSAANDTFWYSTVPGEFFRQNATLPQVVVNVDGINSVCGANCAVATDDTLIPQIDAFSLTDTTLGLTLSNYQAVNAANLAITLGDEDCLIASLNLPSITCTLPALSSGQPAVVAGSLTPKLLVTPIGFAKVATGLTAIEIAPEISTVSPSTGGVSGNILVTITGSGFGYGLPDTYGTLITIDDNPCNIVSLSTTSATCMLPASGKSAATPVDVIVTVNAVAAMKTAGFTYDPSLDPTVTSLSPSTASPTLKTPVTIVGTNFGTNASAVTVYLGTSSNPMTYRLSVTSVTATSIEAILGGGRSGNYSVFVVVDGVGHANYSTFTYQIVVNSVTPTSGSSAGGTLLTIKGSNFSPVTAQNQVFIGDSNAVCNVVFQNTTQLQCITTPNTAGYTTAQNVYVMGRIIEQAICSGTCTFKYDDTITPNITATSASSANAGDAITLTGSKFSATSTLLINGVTYEASNLTGFTASTTQVSFNWPSLPAGNYSLLVNDATHGYSQVIYIVSNLSVTSVTPATLSQAGGIISLAGNGFDTTTQVQVGSTSCQVLTATPSALTCTLGSISGANLAVTANGTSCATCAISASSSATPYVTSVSPSTLDLSSSSTATLTVGGANLLLSSSASIVAQLVSTSNANVVFTGTVSATSTATSLSITFANVAGGQYSLSLHEPGFGYAGFATQPVITVTFSGTASGIVSSIAGGKTLTISGYGFYPTTFQANTKVAVCGAPCQVISSTFSSLTCATPALVTSATQSTYALTSAQMLMGTPIADNKAAITAFSDMGTSTIYSSGSATCYLGYDFGVGLLANLTAIQYLPALNSTASNFVGFIVEGSNDGTTFTTIFTIDQTVHDGWNTWRPEEHGVTNAVQYRIVRFRSVSATTSAQCNFAEITLWGSVYSAQTVSSTSSIKCDAVITFGNASQTLSQVVEYRDDATPRVTSITPSQGTTAGGTTVTISGTNFGTSTSAVSVVIDQVTCVVQTVSATSITCITGARSNLVASSLVVSLPSGKAAGLVTYLYIDRWSDAATWGGEAPPREGDVAYVPAGQVVLMDQSSQGVLEAVVVEGTLIFADQPMTFDAKYIFVHGGQLIIGTESQPFQSNLVITLHGSKTSTQLPIYGNKNIAVRTGSLDIHGVPRNKTWTTIAQTANAGDTSLLLLEWTDWKAGERIVLAPTGFYHGETEEFTITAVGVDASGYQKLTVDQPLQYQHYSGIQTFGTNTIEMRAEVGLLTRNIVIRGDADSERTKYGCHIMIHSVGDDTSVGRISYVEVTQAGQAFNLGRYPIHFHMIGKVFQSYVKGNAIHHTYNRAVTIHGVHYLQIINNIGYHTMGHTFFIEDAVETHNLLDGNLGIKTMRSWSLLNTDQTPATFWITHPNNFFRNNHAAGGDRYGYWFDLKEHPTGPSATDTICPLGEKLGEFTNNTAHSYIRYGLRIFHYHIPRTYPCQPVVNYSNPAGAYASNPPITAHYTNFVSWRNGRNGAIVERIGDVRLSGFKVADNLLAGIEVSMTDQTADGTAQVSDALVVGLSANSGDQSIYTTRGIWGPRYENFQANNVQFFNFNENMAALSMCSHCFHGASTDSGARTMKTSYLSFTNVLHRVIWTTPVREIINDVDGSLTNVTGGWVTPYFLHNDVPQCKRDEFMYNGLVCDSTVQVRKVIFYQAQPPYTFLGMEIKIFRYNASYDLSNSFVDESSYSVLPFRPKTNPMNSWAVPFVTGYTYNVHWRYGLDWTNMTMETSPIWQANDLNLDFRFNYTDRRDQFWMIRTAPTLSQPENITNITTNLSAVDGAGVMFNDVLNEKLYARLNGKKTGTFAMQAIRCYPGGCLPAIETVVQEDFMRVWSNATQWPLGRVPIDGDSVTIPGEWRLSLDVSTANLQYLEIRGSLFCNDTLDAYNLSAGAIFVRNGGIYCGNSTNPYLKKLTITLTGGRFSPYIAISNDFDTGNKVLAVTGTVNLWGNAPGTVWTRLSAYASSGATSIQVASCSGWQIGDQIILATTSMVWNQSDTARIVQITPSCAITLDKALSFDHYGAAQATNVTAYGVFDMRAEVGHLTRNIKIEGTPQDNWGGRVQVAQFLDGDYLRRGQIIFQGVEINNCGQYDTEFSAISFEMLGRNDQAVSVVNSSAIHDSQGWHIHMLSANNVQLINNVFYRAVKFSMEMSNSNNFVVRNNLIAQIHNRPWNVQTFKIADAIAGIYLRDQTTDTVVNIEVSGNSIAGSSWIGFALPGGRCDGSPPAVFNNFAHGCDTGFLGLANQTASCGDFYSYMGYQNFDAFVSCFDPMSQLKTSNMVFGENLNGLTLNTAGETDTPSVSISNTIFIGLPRLYTCPTCYNTTTCSGLHGLRLSYHPKKGIEYPLETIHMFPLTSISTEAAFGANSTYTNISLYDWVTLGGQCQSSTAIQMNTGQPDKSSVHWFSGVTKTNVDDSVLFTFYDPLQAWVNIDDCGNWVCTGPKNLLVFDTDGSLSGNVSTIMSNNPGAADPKTCSRRDSWNGYVCTSQYAQLVFESLDVDKTGRILSPVNITTWSPSFYHNDLNTFMDHTWDGFYTGLVRLSRFPTILPLNQSYNVSFTSTNPNALRYKLQGAPSNAWAIVRLQYTNPQSVQVAIGSSQKVIPPKLLLENQTNDLTATPNCGVNQFRFTQRIIEFVITGASDCYVYLTLIDAVQISLRLNTTVNDFFANNGQASFIDKLCAFLGVSTDRLRIVGVRTGSAIIDFLIQSKDGLTQTAQAAELAGNVKAIVDGVQNSSLNLSAPVLSVSYQYMNVSQSTNTSTTSDGTSSNNQGTTTIIITTKPTNNGTTNTTDPGTNGGSTDGPVIAKSGLSSGWIIAIVIVSVLFGLAVVVAVVLYWKTRMGTGMPPEVKKEGNKIHSEESAIFEQNQSSIMPIDEKEQQRVLMKKDEPVIDEGRTLFKDNSNKTETFMVLGTKEENIRSQSKFKIMHRGQRDSQPQAPEDISEKSNEFAPVPLYTEDSGQKDQQEY